MGILSCGFELLLPLALCLLDSPLGGNVAALRFIRFFVWSRQQLDVTSIAARLNCRLLIGEWSSAKTNLSLFLSISCSCCQHEMRMCRRGFYCVRTVLVLVIKESRREGGIATRFQIPVSSFESLYVKSWQWVSEVNSEVNTSVRLCQSGSHLNRHEILYAAKHATVFLVQILNSQNGNCRKSKKKGKEATDKNW